MDSGSVGFGSFGCCDLGFGSFGCCDLVGPGVCGLGIWDLGVDWVSGRIGISLRRSNLDFLEFRWVLGMAEDFLLKKFKKSKF